MSGFDFDFGADFVSSADRVIGERDEREQLVSRAVNYHQDFLDECLGAILPDDLVLLGASTGAGKTELAARIALGIAESGRRPYYAALEAAPREIERRLLYSQIYELLKNSPNVAALNYRDWYMGRCETLVRPVYAEAVGIAKKKLANLATYYRGPTFTQETLAKLLLGNQDQADVFIIDHLHYVDIADDNENRGYKELTKTIRDLVLNMGKAIVLIAHLRKRDIRSKQAVPSIDDFMGSSDIAKIATRAIVLAPARGDNLPPIASHLAHTFFSVVKDRLGGNVGLVALAQFDMAARKYAAGYTLGRMSPFDGTWSELEAGRMPPGWAVSHRRLPKVHS